MKRHTLGVVSLAWALFLWGIASTSTAEEPATLTKNPFKRPILTPPRASADVAANSDAVLVPGWGIRAILVAGDDSLVNIAGQIIRLGEMHDGFELVSVDESKAVFLRNGELVTVRLYEDEDVPDAPE